MAFDPETAYHGDWQYLDRVKDVVWEQPDGTIVTGLKARWGSIHTPDMLSIAAGLGLSSDAAAIVVWQPKPSDTSESDWEPTFAPRDGHLLRVVTTNEGWVIRDATRLQTHGKWLLLADREVTNA